MLKAKIHLDLFTFDIKVVAEYPDLVDENNKLHEWQDEMNIKE
jgi:hypothetical protein